MKLNHIHKYSKFNISIEINHLILLILLIILFTGKPVGSINPVWMSFYCRQNCDQTFKICAMGASELLIFYFVLSRSLLKPS